jgi:hypothetical protein
MLLALTGCGLIPGQKCPSGTPVRQDVAYVAALNLSRWAHGPIRLDAALRQGCCSLTPMSRSSLSERVFVSKRFRAVATFKARLPDPQGQMVDPVSGRQVGSRTTATVNACGKFLETWSEAEI